MLDPKNKIPQIIIVVRWQLNGRRLFGQKEGVLSDIELNNKHPLVSRGWKESYFRFINYA